jgi:hypothetical protein
MEHIKRSNILKSSVLSKQISLDKTGQRNQNITHLLRQKCEIYFRHHFVVCSAEIILTVTVVLNIKYFVADRIDSICDSEVLTANRTIVTFISCFT